MFRCATEVKVFGRGDQFGSEKLAFLYVLRNSAARASNPMPINPTSESAKEPGSGAETGEGM